MIKIKANALFLVKIEEIYVKIYMKGSDFMNTDNEKVMIDKYEYEYEDFKEYDDLLSLDFAIKIYDGGTNASLNTGTEISIYSYDKYNIQIEGKEHHIKSITLFNKIKKLISDNFDTLVLFSKMETKEFISKNMLIGCSRNVTIKYGQLLISINGAINGNVGNFCKEFIEEIKKLIINEGEKTQEDYMMEVFEKYEPQTPTPLDEEFDKYCKLYEEKFGNQVTIPEPSGTKEFVIECIKKCLQENRDILGDLCYPNFKKDMENGVLYSETKVDLNNDKFDAKTTDENLKSIIDEVIRNNQEIIGNIAPHCNTTVYDIMKNIIDLPIGTTTTIADLINYNPNEKFVEPIIQGQIKRLVKETCKKLNIELDENRDKIGGLAYYSEFKKVNNDKFVWKEGEIKIVKTLCDLCKHNDKEHPSVCSQYPNGTPNDVINNNIKCPRFDKYNRIEL